MITCKRDEKRLCLCVCTSILSQRIRHQLADRSSHAHLCVCPAVKLPCELVGLAENSAYLQESSNPERTINAERRYNAAQVHSTYSGRQWFENKFILLREETYNCLPVRVCSQYLYTLTAPIGKQTKGKAIAWLPLCWLIPSSQLAQRDSFELPFKQVFLAATILQQSTLQLPMTMEFSSSLSQLSLGQQKAATCWPRQLDAWMNRPRVTASSLSLSYSPFISTRLMPSCGSVSEFERSSCIATLTI